MNVILIPFFLAANVVVNDTSEWKFGPEYSYNFTLTFNTRKDIVHREYLSSGRFNSTIKCRPIDIPYRPISFILLCHLGNLTASTSCNNHTAKDHYFEKMFTIVFDEEGVQELTIEESFDRSAMNIIRMIAAQFSMDVNEVRNSEPLYTRNERTILGRCSTTSFAYSSSHPYRRKKFEANQINKDGNFQLEVLTSKVMSSETTLSIEKTRKFCSKSMVVDLFEEGMFEMERFYGLVTIDHDGFTSVNSMHGYVKPVLSQPIGASNTVLLEVERQLVLNSIEPADDEQPEFPVFSNGRMIDLNLKDGISMNLID